MVKTIGRAPGQVAPPPRVRGKLYAFLIAFVSAVGGFLFGYDLAIIGGANGYLREQFALSEGWFGFTTASAGLGCIIGPLFGGWFCDRFGRRSTLVGACLLLAVGSLFTAIPHLLPRADPGGPLGKAGGSGRPALVPGLRRVELCGWTRVGR